MQQNKHPIPVVMYHSVGIPNNNWQWYHLTMPYTDFDSQMKWLSKLNYKTIFLEELYQYIFDNKNLPKNTCVLTFDDGYVDNWVFVYPILKKYNIKATIFVSPDFIDKRNIKRKRLDQVREKNEIKTLENTGYLSWNEMREMEASGLVDIQSHALTHTWYPVSSKIIDYRHSGDKYIWMTWNNNPDKKPYLQYDDKELVQLGEPVYEFDMSLSKKRYFPDPKLSYSLISYVKNNGGPSFFNNKNWREILYTKVSEYKNKHILNDKYETAEEFLNRVKKELSESKRIIETNLNKKVDYLCWPGGSSTQDGVEMARKLGFKLTTAGKDIIKTRANIPNSPKIKNDRVYRLGPTLYWNGIKGKGSIIHYKRGFTFLISIFKFQKRYYMQYLAPIYLKVIRQMLYFYYKIKK